MELNTQNEFNVILNKCYDLVIQNMKESGLIKKWDGEYTNITAEKHFENIVQWCKDNIKSKTWSYNSSSKDGFSTSYGAKHKCEKKLKCYVANNWMKLAMIFSGLEVCDREYVVNKRPVLFHDILTNRINFICRRLPNDPYTIKYNCLFNYEPEELKYIC